MGHLAGRMFDTPALKGNLSRQQVDAKKNFYTSLFLPQNMDLVTKVFYEIVLLASNVYWQEQIHKKPQFPKKLYNFLA